MKGEIVPGTVVQFEPTGALIDIGAKATAYMPTREVKQVCANTVGKRRLTSIPCSAYNAVSCYGAVQACPKTVRKIS